MVVELTTNIIFNIAPWDFAILTVVIAEMAEMTAAMLQ
jgi:hypothetical protein